MMSPYDFMMSQIAQISDIIIRHFEVQQAFKGRRGGSIHQLRRTRRWLLPSSHLTRMHKGPSVSTQCHAALIVLSDLWVVHCLSHSCVVGRLLNHTHICQFWNSGVVKRRGRGKKKRERNRLPYARIAPEWARMWPACVQPAVVFLLSFLHHCFQTAVVFLLSFLQVMCIPRFV